MALGERVGRKSGESLGGWPKERWEEEERS
jgi:hypothetical protein